MKIPLRQYSQLLARYLRPLWRQVVLLACLIFVSISLQLINPQIVAGFIDSVQVGAAPIALLRAAVLFLALSVLHQLCSVATTYASENVGWTTTNALRKDLVAHTLSLDLGFHKAHTPGEMIERIDGDVTAVANFFSRFVVQVLGNGVLIIGVMVVLTRLDWRLGLVIALFALATLVALVGLRNIAVPHFAAERQATAEFYSFLEERLAGTEDIRANGATSYVLRRFYALMREQLRKSLRAGWMVNIMLNASFILFAVSMAAAFAVGSHLFLRRLVSIGTVYLVYDYTKTLEGPLRIIARELQELQRAGAGIGRISQLLGVHNQIAEPPADRRRALPAGALGVAFKHVTFAYRDQADSAGPGIVTGDASGGVPAAGLLPDDAGTGADLPAGAPSNQGQTNPTTTASAPDCGSAHNAMSQRVVLRDVSFELQPGTVLGLLGRTGSGKTTLTRLLLRFYDVDSGSVLLGHDGALVDIRDLPLQALRCHVGIVTQEVQLFNATVRDNLTFFDPTIPDERMVEVIAALGLERWLASLPNGLDTVLDSGGAGLSAGEAQLLAFTRIFLHDPGLVLLDEASSRLDPATEQLIERAVDRLVHNRTAVIIAHRLGTLERADEIMILQDGTILEHGPRAALSTDPTSHFHHLLQVGMEEVMV